MVTGGMTAEVAEFMASLAAQSFRDFELIVVQQNADDRLSEILARFEGAFCSRRRRGVSAEAKRKARGSSSSNYQELRDGDARDITSERLVRILQQGKPAFRR